MLAGGDIRELAADESLFEAGDAYRECVYIHLEGELEQISGRGDRRTAETGDIVGLANYLDGGDYRSTARARDSARVLEVPASIVQRLEREDPAFFEAINRALAARMRKARQVRETVRGTLARPVRQFMHSGLATCSRNTTLAEATGILERRQIGSLGVLDDDGKLMGLLTPMSIASALSSGNVGPDDSVDAGACQTPYSVTPDTPLWEVEELQQQNRVKYVVVIDEDDTPIGMVSQTDLVRALATPSHTLDADIANAGDIDTLVGLRSQFPVAARRIRDTHRNVGRAVRVFTDMHLALQHRAIELILEEMQKAGEGPPPARFSIIIMGSGGRGEMLLGPDQDNGLILGDDIDEAGQRWFARFAERFNPALDRLGYPLCPGDIMTSNPDFRRTLSQWKRAITRLVENPHAKGARWSTIVFDFTTQYGDDSLTLALREHLNNEMKRATGLLKLMARDDAEGRPPLGLFNRLLTTRHEGEDTIDVKRNGLRIIVDGIRIHALEHGITRTGTRDRLHSLGRLGVFDPDFVESLRMAFEELLDLLLEHQLHQTEKGRKPDPLVRVNRLTEHDRERLRVALRTAKRMQDHLQGMYGLTEYWDAG